MTPGSSTIVLAMFGTSVESGLAGLLHVRDRMAARFQETRIHMAFTSKVLRQIWKERAADPEYRSAHPEVPDEILNIRSPAKILRSLTGMDRHSLVIQPVHIAPLKVTNIRNFYLEDSAGAAGKDAVFPFQKIAFGRPALGILDQTSSYKKDIVRVARSLAEDIDMARQKKAALFYMGHGNRYAGTQKVYNELVTEIRRQYPDVLTFMSMVEGDSSTRDIARELRAHGVGKVLLKAFLVVAGNHARKDMVGRGTGSLHTFLMSEGIVTIPVMTGLGENTLFADIFVQHAAEAAESAGIILR